jgi:hypothetical protein
MNENDQTNTPPPIAASLEPVPSTAPTYPKPFSWWVQKLFACNPFYLVSAALLLYGCYRVSVDAPLFNVETARLLFNFISVQVYEVLLVFTAVFLARRCIWYDSTLLVGLENLLVFVPFIFISLAALIDSSMAFTMSLVGAAVVLLRFGSLKKFFTNLNLPWRVLKIGAAFLALNVALPLLYRHFGETKVGIHIESGAAYMMNEFTWLLILPAVLALANIFPRVGAGGNLPPQHRWLPAGMFALWIVVTGVHLYGLDYVYQFEFRSELFAPAIWVLAWTASRRFSVNNLLARYALMIPPALAPLIAIAPNGNKTFLILCALNIAGYFVASLLDRKNQLARHLFAGSILLLVSGLPERWVQMISPGLLRTHWIAAGLSAYLLFYTALSRNPKLAMLGAIIFGCDIGLVFGAHNGVVNWSVQGGFVFFLLHSLRWNDGEHSGASLVRTATALAWVIQSFVWMSADAGRFWMPIFPGVVVLGISFACQPCRLGWQKATVPVAALLVILSGPCHGAAESVRAMPVGLIAVIGSFLFFGFGTVAALTRRHWRKHEQEREVELPKAHNRGG